MRVCPFAHHHYPYKEDHLRSKKLCEKTLQKVLTRKHSTHFPVLLQQESQSKGENVFLLLLMHIHKHRAVWSFHQKKGCSWQFPVQYGRDGRKNENFQICAPMLFFSSGFAAFSLLHNVFHCWLRDC